MGLDSHIFSYEKPTENEHIYNKLVGEKPETLEVLYWRKNWEIVKFFGIQLDTEIENCEEYPLDKTTLKLFLYALEHNRIDYPDFSKEQLDNDIKILKRILKETDFDKTKFFFANWW